MITQWPDVKQVRSQARREWERTARRKISISERIGQSVAWWLVAIAAAFFALSAPHTISIMDRLAPGWGWIAPIGVECCLLYAAYTRRKLNGGLTSIIRVLEAMAFVASVVVNAAGAFVAVVNSAGVANQSVQQLMNAFATLPATSEVSLVLVPLFALMIPVGTAVAGEGVAALILERRAEGDLLDQKYKPVRSQIEYVALRDAAIALGHEPEESALWANSITKTNGGRLPKQKFQEISEISQKSAETLSVKKAVDLLKANPEHVDLIGAELVARYGGSEPTWSRAKKAFSSNGHQKE